MFIYFSPYLTNMMDYIIRFLYVELVLYSSVKSDVFYLLTFNFGVLHLISIGTVGMLLFFVLLLPFFVYLGSEDMCTLKSQLESFLFSCILE